jgi:hypothetical protein
MAVPQGAAAASNAASAAQDASRDASGPVLPILVTKTFATSDVMRALPAREAVPFFLKKKNQKTSFRWVSRRCDSMRQAGNAREQKFFASFFQKRRAFLLRHPHRADSPAA